MALGRASGSRTTCIARDGRLQSGSKGTSVPSAIAGSSDGDRLALRALVAGLNDPSSGAVVGNRLWFIESKYGLLTHRQAADGPVPSGVPFDLQSVVLPDL
ncbi:MAG: hypothetical protein ACJ8GJ_10230 [Vitreoscilla sp.]